MYRDAFGWNSYNKSHHKLPSKIQKEVIEYGGKFVNQVNMKPHTIVAKVL